MALADIPGYGAYIEKRRMNEAAPLAELQQAGAVQGFLANLQKQKKAQQYEAELAALGPTPSQESLVSLASKYAGPEKALDIHQKSLDRQATATAAKEAAAARIEQQKASADMVHEFRMSRLTADEDRAAETARHNKAIEGLQAEMNRIRGDAATQKNLPKPKTGYRWNAEGTEQEPIPGGPVARQLTIDSANAKRSVDLTVQNLDRLDTAMGELDADPGLDRITGPVAGRTPNLTAAATGAQAKLDSIKSQIFVSALQSMRDASKTGGALGQVTEREGDKLENSIAALAQAQGTADFKVQLAKARAQLKASKAIIQRAYSEQYGQGGGTSGGPARVTNDAEYNALPSGTEFIGPDGQTRRKP